MKESRFEIFCFSVTLLWLKYFNLSSPTAVKSSFGNACCSQLVILLGRLVAPSKVHAHANVEFRYDDYKLLTLETYD